MTQILQSGSDNPHAYDVAISFLAEDEPLALCVADALAPLNVFVYSKKQEELAGREGDEAFRDIFRNRARLSVVLFRPRWGSTKWTRVEESAIRDRCFAEGWKHLMFVCLDKAALPGWLPERYIYLDYEQFGLDGLVGATKARCLDLGAQLRVMSAAERARKLAESERFARETEQLVRSSAQPMYDTARVVFEGLTAKLSDIQQSTGWTAQRDFDAREFVAVANGRSLQLECTWSPQSGSAELSLRVFTGQILTPEQRRSGRWIVVEQPTESQHERFALARVPEVGWCWARDGRELTADALAEHAANEFVSALGRPVDNSAEVLGQIFRRRP